MITLHNGCWSSDLTVNPRNWRTQRASVKTDWYIQYYFHDPSFQDDPRLKNGKYVQIRGMNKFKTPAERRTVTQQIIEQETKDLQRGYNPITDKYSLPEDVSYEISPVTPFVVALERAYDRLKTSKDTKYAVKSCLKYMAMAAEKLRLHHLDIQSIRMRHIYQILEQCEKHHKRWSNQTYNHYRAYLMMLFKVLRRLEAIEINPVLEVEKLPIARMIRPTLSNKQRKLIDDHLLKHDPDFRRYIHIFFHSGSRSEELSRIQGKDVDLEMQRFKVTVKKGQVIRQEWRPIKHIALPFWEEAMAACEDNHYVFSRGFRPYKDAVIKGYVTGRWRELIKKPVDKGGLGINVDFYSLKHLNLDETAAQLDLQAAADMAGHTTPVITLKYAQGERERQNERLKGLDNKFA